MDHHNTGMSLPIAPQPLILAESFTDGDAQRQLLRRAATVGLLMRHTVTAAASLIALADTSLSLPAAGRALLAATTAWSIFRVCTRDHRRRLTIIDFTVVVAVCVALPWLVDSADFYTSNTAPQAIAGTAVVSFSVTLPSRLTLPMTLAIAAAYAWGSSVAIGSADVTSVGALYYFALQWGTGSAIRFMLVRVADNVDRARRDRLAAELDEDVAQAVRDYQQEQLALLHDTAASTLLLVGQGAAVPTERVAAQAQRDLALLDEGPFTEPAARADVVAGLRECADHVVTAVHFTGLATLTAPGSLAKAVVAAAREAMTNVERHAGATRLWVEVTSSSVVLTDDGRGFDVDQRTTGRGIAQSIVARMERAGGRARIESAPGRGTTVELAWSPAPVVPDGVDPERLIDRIQLCYGLALTIYAVANLAFSSVQAVATADDPPIQGGLAGLSVLATLAAVPAILYGRTAGVGPALVVLLAVTAVQPLTIPTNLVGSAAHWAQATIGWCVVPMLLSLPVRRAAAVLVACWSVGGVVTFACNPIGATAVNIGLGSASILGLQLFAITFNTLVRGAADEAEADIRARHEITAQHQVSAALHAEYRHRYEEVVGSVLPVLRALSVATEVNADLRSRARTESRRLRALFDQSTIFDHPLMRHLRILVDGAEARNVGVTVDAGGDLPDLSAEQITRLVTPIAAVLDATTQSARVVVTSSPTDVTASIVSQGALSSEIALDAHNVEQVVGADATWTLITCSLRQQPPRHKRRQLVRTKGQALRPRTGIHRV